ncbi:MAG: mechanosensitive ion channel [Sandaracinaceae bacterium]|nr:mechanosensitive ion channel [Sandaracinaceae bacterium]
MRRRTLRSAARALAALGITASSTASAQVQELSADSMSGETFRQLSHVISWSGVAVSAVVILVAWAITRFARRAVERLSEQFADRRLTLHKALTVLQFTIYLVVAVLVLKLSLRLDDRLIALIGGTIAVGVGLAIKDLVASLIAGVLIMADRPFQVGDRVQFEGHYGDITAIGLRSVRMVTLDDNVVTIPNNKFLSGITSSGNYGALDMQVATDFLIGVDQDVALAEQIVREAAVSSRHVHLPKPVVVLIAPQVVGSYLAIQLRLKAYVLDTKYEKAFTTDVNRRVLTAFRAAGVLPPAQLHRTLPESVALELSAE